jgi:glycosyltransferase involved in cell wall biosynthesis
LHVVFSLDAGGLENGVINVANRLNGEYEIHVACLDQPGRMAARFAQQDRLHRLERGEGFSIRAVARLARCIRATRPHVLHTHNLGPLIYGALASGLGRSIPILHGEHGQLTETDLEPKRLRQRRCFYRCARVIHTVSQGQAGELAACGLGAAKVKPVINGVDTSRFCPRDDLHCRARLGIPSEDLAIGMVGRFISSKRHETLIQAFEQVRSRGMPLHLLLVGAGGSEEECVRRRCQSSREAGFIHLFGFSEDPEHVYPALDLVVLPSVHEGLSNVVLEAMACGVPVLSHQACGSAEVIQSGVDGVVADLGSPELLAQELEQLVADRPRLRQFGQRAREKVMQSFSLERMSREYAALYDSLRRD